MRLDGPNRIHNGDMVIVSAVAMSGLYHIPAWRST